jgi:hypothetical protein
MFIFRYANSMGRISFPKGSQSKWVESILKNNKANISEIAKICLVSERTVRDWRREKFKISESAFNRLMRVFDLSAPKKIKILPSYWYAIKGARNGALRRQELYGPLGTPEGRRKGGIISQRLRKLYPEKYSKCILRKKFDFPKRSENLSEMVGIILGDGGITDYQLKISLNRETEPDYVNFVATMFKDLFGEDLCKYYYGGRSQKVCTLCANGVSLVEFLGKLGLGKGSKVFRQADVPEWVKRDRRYSIACLRGLFDTDGGVFSHKHCVNGFPCLNYGLAFGNHSKPILKFFYNVLSKEGFSPKLKETGVFLYRQDETSRYFDIIGSHNGHHIRNLKRIIGEKSIRRSTQVAVRETLGRRS